MIYNHMAELAPLCMHAVLPMDQLFPTLLEHLQREVKLLLNSHSNANKLKVCMLPGLCSAPLACLSFSCKAVCKAGRFTL